MVNTTDIISPKDISDSFWSSFTPVVSDKLTPLITIGKVVGIAFLIYLIVLIIQALFRMQDSHRLKVIAENSTKINEKLDMFLHKKEEHKKHEK